MSAEPFPNPFAQKTRPLFCCANSRCQRDLGIDHVTLITTAHVRRFCSVECIEGPAGRTGADSR